MTIGPDDEHDVRRVGEVMGDSVLSQKHHEVCRAMRSFRGAHVKLGRRLAETARLVGPAAVVGHRSLDEVIDERSGLTAADFQDAIEILTVESVEPMGEVPSASTGRLRGPEEEDEHA